MINEVAEYLEDQSIGTVGTDIFISRQSDTPDNQIVIYLSGGLEPDRYLPTADPTFEIVVRNKTYQTGQSKVDSIVTALHQYVNGALQTSGTYFYYIELLTEPNHIGRDEKGRHEWSINFLCKTRR